MSEQPRWLARKTIRSSSTVTQARSDVAETPAAALRDTASNVARLIDEDGVHREG